MKNEDPTLEYLGDGLYVNQERGQVRLFAHDGMETLNEVFLDEYTLRSFLKYLRKHGIAVPKEAEKYELPSSGD